MVISHELSVHNNLLVYVCAGQFKLDVFLDYVDRVMIDPDWNPKIDVIADLSTAIVKTDFNLMIKFITYIEKLSFSFRGCKWAVVYPKDINNKMLVLYNKIGDQLNLQAKTFATMDDARMWINDKT